MPQRPIAPGLFDTVDGRPRLIGGRRLSDGKVVFPMPEGGEAKAYEAIPLASEGTLWSFTVQRFRPKSPPYAGDDDDKSFRPFALGYVELPGQVIVESRLETDDFASLRVGQPMALTLAPFRKDPDGTDVLTFAFAPLA